MNYRPLPVVLFLAGLWIQLSFVLFPSWQNQSYYDYGWMIPPIILFFGFHRWPESSAGESRPSQSTWLLVAILMSTLMLVPIRFAEHVDIYWKIPLWIHALLVLTITHLTIARIRGWKTSRALLPASLFILLAIPLPSRIEQPFVNELTEVVLEFTSFLLPFIGYPILTSGSTLIVHGEILDVAEGCSGIRSFQSCIVAALALGELNRFSIPRRLALLILSVGLAVLMNSLRVFALVQIVHEGGQEELNATHDTVGFWATIATFSSIALVAWFLTRFMNDRSRKMTRSSWQKSPSSQNS